MSEALPSERDNPKVWVATAASKAPRTPPYSANMKVTPLSVYGDNRWIFPSHWIAVNNRDRLVLDFESVSMVAPGSNSRLRPGHDDKLIDQLKQATWASLYRRETLPPRRKQKLVKPGGAHQILRRLRRVFVGFSRAGCNSLSEVTTHDLASVFEAFAAEGSAFGELVDTFQDLIVFSRAGLIEDGLKDLSFELSPASKVIPDLNAPLGHQPISDKHVAKLIRASNRYIDLAEEIAEHLETLAKRPERRRSVVAWARSNLPCGSRFPEQDVPRALASLVQIAAANLLSFHSGLRVSEVLSCLVGFVRPASDGIDPQIDHQRMVLHFTTHKAIQDFRGANRSIKAHPRLLVVASALVRVKEALGIPGEYLFVPSGEEQPYITNQFNYYLQRFCDLNDVQIDISSHMWRKTVASVAVRVLTGASLHLKELFGHSGLAMVSRYILASPFIRDEVRDLCLDEYRRRGLTLLESLKAIGGPGLGGRHGQVLEERFDRFLRDTDITEIDLKKSLDGFVEEMLRQGIVPVPVMEGVLCMKPRWARGECSQSSGDRLADPARCSARCSWQVQKANRRGLLRWTIGRTAAGRARWSPMEETYWAAQCRDQLMAWPDLASELHDVIEGWPKLKALLREARDGEEEKLARRASQAGRPED